MRKIIIILTFLLGVAFGSCKTRNCNNIPKSFSSYQDAIRVIKNSSFKLKDSINIDKGSYMKSASYYSCDKKSGYFFYKEDAGYEYFVSDVPIKIWMEFKKADSKETYYDSMIKGHYTSVYIVVDLDKLNKD